MWPVCLYLFIYLTRAEDAPTYTDHCHGHHAIGLETLIRTSGQIALAETDSIRERYNKALSHTFAKMERKKKRVQRDVSAGSSTAASTTAFSITGSTASGGSSTVASTTVASTTAFASTTTSNWNPNCPRPNATMFTVAPKTTVTYAHFTQPMTTTSMLGSTTAGSTTSSPSSTQSSSTVGGPSPPTTIGAEDDKQGFQPVPLYSDHDEDPLVVHFNRLHKYISRPEAACDVQQITSLNDLTEDHLYGFVASLVTTDVGPFCSICHRMVNEVRKRAFVVSTLLHDEEQQLMAKIFHSHVPSTKTICSALAPACFEKYEEKVKKVSPGLLCAECSACMTVTNVIQHRFLLNPTAVQSIYNFLRSSLFHNICAELCNSLNNKNLTYIWPNDFQYGACQNWFENQYNGVIKFITTLTRPERFCSLELGWCELNEVPNMLQCLPEFCEEFRGNNALLKLVCKLLEGKNQQEAAEFIGVSNTKRYKEKKEYHDKITVHEEL